MAYELSLQNERRRQPQDIPQEPFNQFTMYKMKVDEQMEARMTEEMNIDEMAQTLEEVLMNCAEEVFPRKTKLKKKHYIQEETWNTIELRNAMWPAIRNAGKAMGIPKWESLFREKRKEHREATDLDDMDLQVITAIVNSHNKDFATVRTAWTTWRKWDEIRRLCKQMVKQDKLREYDKILAEAAQQQDELDLKGIWKCVDRLASKKHRSNSGMMGKKGKWCMTDEAELQAVQEHMETNLHGKAIPEEDIYKEEHRKQLQRHHPAEGEKEWFGSAEVKSSMRRSNLSKQTPSWTATAAMWRMAEDTTTPWLQKIWQGIGQQGRLPYLWETLQTFRLPKQGKDPRHVENRRGVSTPVSAARGYLACLQTRFKEAVSDVWGDCEFGGLPGRSTTHAMLMLDEFIHRARRAHKSFMVYFGDEVRAFDRVLRTDIADSIYKHVENTDLADRLVMRMERTIYSTTQGEAKINVVVKEGTVQGDPCAGLYYSLAKHDLQEEVIAKRSQASQMGVTMTGIIHEEEDNKIIDLSTSFFVDDEMDMEIIEDPEDVKTRLSPIFECQQQHGIATNYGKSNLFIKFFGQGTKRKQARFKQGWTYEHNKKIPTNNSMKYLGGIFHVNSTTVHDITHKINQAKQASARLHRLLKSQSLEIRQRVMFYKVIVRAILTYGAEIRLYPARQIKRLETYQMKILQLIKGVPTFISKQSSRSLREELEVPSIDTFLRWKRLRWWHNVIKDTNNLRAVRAIIFGKFEWEAQWPSQVNSARIRLLLEDLEEYVRATGNRPPEGLGFNQITFQWFGLQAPGSLEKVVGFHSQIEENLSAPMFGPHLEPNFACPDCSMKFNTHKQLQTHRYKSHGVRNPLREAIASPYCPVCRSTFTSLQGARQHFEKICGLKLSESEIAALQADARRKREAERTGQNSNTTSEQPPGPSVMVLLHLNAARNRREAQAGA